MSKPVRHFYEFGRFRLDPAERRLLGDGVPVPLTPKAFETLVFFVRNNKHLLTKEELMQAVWKDAFVEENNLEKIISVLRKTLGGNDTKGNYIETVRRCGYRFTANVCEIGADEDSGEQKQAAERPVFKNVVTNFAVEPHAYAEPINDAPRYAMQFQSPAIKFALTAGIKKREARILIVAASILLIFTFSFFNTSSPRGRGQSETRRDKTFTLLTNGGNIRNATISPDGKYFVYEEQGDRVSRLWLRQTGQSNSIEIIPAAQGAIHGTTFSPDGQFIYYAILDENYPDRALYRVPTLGGVQTKLLTNIASPVTFSPDGKQIAFVRNEKGPGSSSRIIVASSDGGSARILVTRKGAELISTSGLGWSPDGKLIAIGAMREATKTSEPICEILGIDVQTGATKPLTEQKWDSCGRIAWTSDGRGFVMIGTKQGESDSARRDQVWYVTFPEDEVQRVTTDSSRNYNESLAVTNDNSLLVVPFNRTPQIWSMKAIGDSRTAVQLTNGTSDGRGGIANLNDNRIAYVARTGDNVDIWQMNADGTEQK